MNTTNRIATLVALYIIKKLSPAESRELFDWRNFSPENERKFLAQTDPNHIITELAERQQIRKRIFDEIKDEISVQPKKRTSEKVYKVLRMAGRSVLSAAAGLFLFVIITVEFLDTSWRDHNNLIVMGGDFTPLRWNWLYHAVEGGLAGFARISAIETDDGHLIGTAPEDAGRPNINTYMRLLTPPDAGYTLKFSDGTTIILDTFTIIKYPGYMKQDTIHLYINGAAHIYIPPTTPHHYIITVSPPPVNGKQSPNNAFRIETRGGEFKVRAYENGTTTTVTVLDRNAWIDVTGGKAVPLIFVKPGQRLKLESGKLNVMRKNIKQTEFDNDQIRN